MSWRAVAIAVGLGLLGTLAFAQNLRGLVVEELRVPGDPRDRVERRVVPLEVLPDALDFHAQLGFLVSAFKERIETELIEQLDKMMAAAPARKRKSAAKKPA